MSQVKECPILFSGPMVRAILEGRKTVARRVVKPGFPDSVTEVFPYADAPYAWMPALPSGEPWYEQVRECPHGRPGDRLWVRETWLEDPEDDGTWAYTQYMGCKGSPLSDIPKRFQKPDHCLFRASWNGSDLRWRPSTHMPRWASRILLEITSVRVKRLQDITEEQARAEGMLSWTFEEYDGDPRLDGQLCTTTNWHWEPQENECDGYGCAQYAFAGLWKAVNGESAWDANPWVWVVEFKRVQP